MPKPPSQRFILDRQATPIGDMLLVADEAGALRVLDWHDYEPRMRLLLRRHYGAEPELVAGRLPRPIRDALEAYYAGDLAALDRIPVASGGTAFQRDVWTALRAIPAGTTVTYGTLARRIGREAAVRAVGAANGANPIGVVVPCHRVIGADGTLTGYGGGIERKRWLLRHEGVATEEAFA
jgi:methylated-DNA-[protein]-cysteine S-methyltransferase